MAATISRLEKSINSYKEEYAQLISQAEAIKTDLKHVQVRRRFANSLMMSVFSILMLNCSLGYL